MSACTRLANFLELTEGDVSGCCVLVSASKLIALTAAALLAGELVAAWKLAVRRAILGLVICCKLAGSGLRGVMPACKDL